MPLITIKAPEPEKPKLESEAYSVWKVIIIILFSAVPAAVFSYLFLKGEILFSLIPAVLFISVAILRPFILRNKKLATISIISDSALLLLPVLIFRPNFNQMAFAAAGGFLFISFLIGYVAGKRLDDNSLKIKFIEGCGAAFPGIYNGFIVFIAIIIGFSSTPADLMSHNLLDPVIKIIADPVVAYLAPNTNSSSKLSVFASVKARQLLTDQEGVQQFTNLPDEVKKIKIQEVQTLFIEELNKKVSGINGEGVALKADSTILENIYNILTGSIKKSIDNLPSLWLSALITLSLFFMLKTVGFIIRGITTLLAFFIAQLLIATKFIGIILEERSKETYSIK